MFDQTSYPRLDISYLAGTNTDIVNMNFPDIVLAQLCSLKSEPFSFRLENFMTSVLGRSVKLVGETIVGPNLWGLWSADLRPNLISPLFAPAAKFNTFPLQREDARFLLLNKIKRNLIISFPEEGGDI